MTAQFALTHWTAVADFPKLGTEWLIEPTPIFDDACDAYC